MKAKRETWWKTATHVRVWRPCVMKQSLFILDKKLMAKFVVFVSTSVGCWLTSDGMFLYVPYFSFVFPVFCFGIDATQRKSTRQLIRFAAVIRWWHFHMWLFIFLKKKKNPTLITSTWSFGYHPQMFLVSNLQAMGCSWSVISPLCSCCFSCVVAHWALQVVAWIFVCTRSCISILSHFCSWMLFRNGATYHA